MVHFNADEVDVKVIHPPHPPRHLHHRAGSASGTHDRGGADYFRAVSDAMGDAEAFLVLGPSTAKTEFTTWLQETMPHAWKQIFGVQAAPKMSDRELAATARQFFKSADLMRPRIDE